MRYAQVQKGRVVNVVLTDEPSPDHVPSETANIGYLYDGSVFIDPRNQVDLETLAVRTVEGYLDEVAHQYRYDSFRSLVTYASSSIPLFAMQAASGLALRDQAWALLLQMQGEIEGGAQYDILQLRGMLDDIKSGLPWE